MTATLGSERIMHNSLGRRLLITIRARSALASLSRADGPLHVVLSWPAGATTLPERLHRVGPHDVIIGYVAKCPIYADVRQLGLFRDRRMVLDIPEPIKPPRRPILRLHHAPLPRAG